MSGEGNRPTWIRNSVLDPLGGLDLLCGVLLALYHRCATDDAGQVSASLLGTAALTCSETVVPVSTSRPLAVPALDSDQTGIAPGYRIYECTDGWVAVAAVTDTMLNDLRRIGETDQESDLVPAIRRKAVAAFADELAAKGVPHEIVKTDAMDEFLDSAANRESRLSVTYETPEYGRFDQIGEYWHFPENVQSLERPVPSLGEHSRDLLTSLGVDASTIDILLEKGIVVDWSRTPQGSV